MKKNLILTSVVAIMATVAGANAATDVTFAGDYTNSNGDTVNVNDAVAAETYSYEKSDGTTRDVANQTTDPTLEDFTYTDKDGNPADLSSGTKTQSDFTGVTAASGVVSTTQEIVSGATVERGNYTYTNGAGDTVELGTSAQDMTQTVTLNSDYTNGAEIVVTNGTADSFDGTLYSVTMDGDDTYHLSADGTALYHSNNTPAGEPEPGSALADAFDAMKTEYANDVASVDSAKTTTADQWTTEQANFATADAAFTTDSNKVEELNGYWNSYETAAGLLETAQAKQQAAKEAYSENDDALTAAKDIFYAPIEETIDTHANDAIEASVASGTIKTALDDKANVDDVYSKADADAKFLTEHQDISGKANVADVDAALALKADSSALTDEASAREAKDTELEQAITDEASAREEKDTELQQAITDEASTREEKDTELQQAITDEASARANADQQLQQQINASIADADALTLKKANSYTDAKVNTLEKNLSGGVAAATALSSVAVSNVKKGEVSVGGGYGYYNSQSAMAFGAAMGLSDRWSVNAGAGIASGDKTQVAFRAGTNYKFKLF